MRQRQRQSGRAAHSHTPDGPSSIVDTPWFLHLARHRSRREAHQKWSRPSLRVLQPGLDTCARDPDPQECYPGQEIFYTGNLRSEYSVGPPETEWCWGSESRGGLDTPGRIRRLPADGAPRHVRLREWLPGLRAKRTVHNGPTATSLLDRNFSGRPRSWP